MTDQGQPVIGFFGKISTHGDFVSRRLSESFIQAWDDWLQHGLSLSKDRLGVGWLDAYLTSPLWRFVVTSGVINELNWCGVVMPSIDRVGRHFPLTIAVGITGGVGVTECFKDQHQWFDDLEVLALSTLEIDFSLEKFDLALQNMPVHFAENNLRHSTPSNESASFRFGVESLESMATHTEDLLSRMIDTMIVGKSLWWTEGSPLMSPSILTCNGLPKAEQYVAMIDGQWANFGLDTH